jgi:hypothetical protein
VTATGGWAVAFIAPHNAATCPIGDAEGHLILTRTVWG